MKTSLLGLGLASLVACGTMLQPAHAQPAFWSGLDPNLVAYDPFLSGGDRGAGEYSAGVDMRTMGAAAFGWVGTGTPSIDGFGVAHSGNTSNFQGNSTGEDAAVVGYEQGGRMQWIGAPSAFDRNITRQLNAIPSSSEWWMSIQLNRLGAGWAGQNASTYVVGGFTDANGSGLQFGYDDTAADGDPDIILRTGGANTVLAADSASSANIYMLAQLLVNPTGNDTLNIWVDPVTLDPAPLADFSLTTLNITDSLTPFTQSKYESPGVTGNVFFDEIRLGTTFEAVTEIPEPTTLALMGLAGTALLARRRRA